MPVALALPPRPFPARQGNVEDLRRWIDNYDAVILSCKEFAQEMKPPQRMMMPAIDPFTIKNRHLSDREIDERLAHYEIPTDLPLVVQISRFDPWKDPKGVVEAFKLARKQIDARLVLLGNFATDDPEGEEIFHSLCALLGRTNTNSDQWR
jgi:trehalose synthase